MSALKYKEKLSIKNDFKADGVVVNDSVTMKYKLLAFTQKTSEAE